TYTMILDRTIAARQSITFYLDGQRYFRVRESQVGAPTWRAAFDHKLSIIFDLAMGGGYPNGVCGCTSPTSSTSSGGTMSVAYVAAYQTAGSSGSTGPITRYGGLCAADPPASPVNRNPGHADTCHGAPPPHPTP